MLFGAATNAGLAALVLLSSGAGQPGLRAATRATGQAALLPFAPYFADRTRERAGWLGAYAGAHVTHAVLLARLIHTHGHPAVGTPVLPMSVGGGGLGHVALTARLLGAPRRVIDWYLFAVVQGLPIPHAYLTKGRSPLYALPAALWTAALIARLSSTGAPARRRN